MDSYPVSRPDFGAWLKQIIKAAGVPLTELSRLSGIAYPNLNAIVNSGAKGKPIQPEEPTMVKLITALIALNIIEDENDAWIEAGYRPQGYTLAKESQIRYSLNNPGSPISPVPTSVLEFFDGTVSDEEMAFVEKTIALIGSARMRLPARLGQ